MNKRIIPLYHGRANFLLEEGEEYRHPEGARPLQEPAAAEVCKMKLGVAQKVNTIREADRIEEARRARLGLGKPGHDAG